MHDMCSQLRAATHPRRRFPLTSRHNLQDFPKFSPTSTVLSAKHASRSSHIRAIDATVKAASGSSNQLSHTAPLVADLGKELAPTDMVTTPRQSSYQDLSNHDESHGTQNSGTGDHDSSSEWDEWWESNSTLSMPSDASTRLVQLAPNRPRFIDLLDLEIMAEIQSPSVGTMALDRHSAVDDIPTSHVIQLDELQAGHELTFERGENEACVVLRLMKGSSNLCRMELKWS